MLKLTVVFLLAAISVNAQQISGNITDKQKKAVTGSTISLLAAKDSIVKLSTSDKDGNFIFQNIKAGSYRVRAAHIG